MKKFLLASLSVFTIAQASNAAVHVVINIGTTSFSPDTVFAVGGDIVQFNLTTGHTATSVSQATWLANGTTPNGAFNYSSPGGTYNVPSMTGYIYYVCTIHVGTTGMKGVISVTPSSIEENNSDWTLSAFPNPADNFITLRSEGLNGKMNVRVLNVLGEDVMPVVQTDLNNFKIQITSLASGTYFIRVENGDRTRVLRFVKK